MRSTLLALRQAAVLFAAVLLVGVVSAPAAALTPPIADPAALPPDPAPSPSSMVHRVACVTTGVLAGTAPDTFTTSQAMRELPAAWRFSRGEGQTVAVIDTGVQPGPRLPNVEPGGDYIAETDGLTDCDGHGTLVAGIIAGQPAEHDAFAGVAPAARLLSIRQRSRMFDLPGTGELDLAAARAAFEVNSLARAIVHAADLGARVITVPAATCVPADGSAEQATLGAAIRYASIEMDAVIIAAAGNTGTDRSGLRCESNPLTDLSRPEDPRNWTGVTSVSTPSWWQPYVLSVGSVTPDGQPSAFSMAGPWVGAAAPGQAIVSVGNGADGGLANGTPNHDGEMIPIDGTGFAAAFVSGVAALVRSRYPELTATQVVDRISRTARNPARSPSNLLGTGIVDPIAALTWELPADYSESSEVKQISLPPAPPAENPLPRNLAFWGVGVLAVGVLLVAVATARRRTGGTP